MNCLLSSIENDHAIPTLFLVWFAMAVMIAGTADLSVIIFRWKLMVKHMSFLTTNSPVWGSFRQINMVLTVPPLSMLVQMWAFQADRPFVLKKNSSVPTTLDYCVNHATLALNMTAFLQ